MFRGLLPGQRIQELALRKTREQVELKILKWVEFYLFRDFLSSHSLSLIIELSSVFVVEFDFEVVDVRKVE